EPPYFLARRLLEARKKSTDTIVAARDARDDQVADYERRAGAVVVLMPVGHLVFPKQRAREPVERDEMTVIGDHEHTVATDRDATICATGRHADQTFRPRAAVVPDLTSAAGVERVALVRARHV